MQVAKVRGTVVSTQKDPSLRGVKLLLLQLVDEDGNILPQYEVAADSVGAGVDEWVLVSRGSAARQVIGNEQRPLDAVVVAIIDTIHVEDRLIYSKKDQYR
ncbi:EutN/CcmL family microcompartment protein [Nostoc sp. UIC 10607]|jgi:carbon dioxide concentrating mechanism protein CcmL|uniref:Carboxysome shell vertex protein CcmL n=4 Tax=Nostoc TaxID=1177 RepID=A0A5P8W3X0_9NOSO|nr:MULTISPECIES: EutN/CcmL family microcompartment protein [Nostoc]MBC6429950.1 carbon dioxide concentrating mechanism protein CcmL [Nostoc sp. HG1]MCC5649234.1 EutN/CcmL family microcompartment protein [Nostoc sp. XA013]MCL6749523.1 EutN/CcmL family microcompartment protein [Nostoc sp. CCCryo 231-06]AUB38675.1 ccmL, carbon dioxide concentrating mechanism protein CcmL [Nostoc flagelliforme CCNUN1]MBD2246665.1 EutN/CcmL family microcompartment protein [Nostoc sp. FACHB-888]